MILIHAKVWSHQLWTEFWEVSLWLDHNIEQVSLCLNFSILMLPDNSWFEASHTRPSQPHLSGVLLRTHLSSMREGKNETWYPLNLSSSNFFWKRLLNILVKVTLTKAWMPPKTVNGKINRYVNINILSW